MNVNRKFDRFKQWAGERMGGEVKTGVSDNFKSLEQEMVCRHEGMERLHKSMTGYVKSISKTKEVEEKDRSLPVGHLGTIMIGHGEQLDRESEFGSSLISMGRAHESIARVQERYIARATSSWLESLERSLAQMKEYTAARKKLEARRLAYDASLSKVQKAKREDFRVEEELRSQKAKYEESNEDVLRRMQDIQEAELESVADLGAFLEAELEYHDRCREVLLKLKRDWPATSGATVGADARGRPPYDALAPAAAPAPSRPSIRSSQTTPIFTDGSPDTFASGPIVRSNRAAGAFAGAFAGAPSGRVTRIPTDPIPRSTTLTPVRPASRVDASDESTFSYSSPDRSCEDLAESPTTSHDSGSVVVPYSGRAYHGGGGGGRVDVMAGKKAAPPPPPPSRAKKPPPPPPPPAKRGFVSSAAISYS